jgi:hypothetical protein
MHGSRSKIPSKKSRPYIYIYIHTYIHIKFLALLVAPYIYDISRLRVKISLPLSLSTPCQRPHVKYRVPRSVRGLHWIIHFFSCLYKCRQTVNYKHLIKWNLAVSVIQHSPTEWTVQCLQRFTCSKYWSKFSGKIITFSSSLICYWLDSPGFKSWWARNCLLYTTQIGPGAHLLRLLLSG